MIAHEIPDEDLPDDAQLEYSRDCPACLANAANVPVTLLGAVILKDSVLVAGDRQVGIPGGYTRQERKLYRLGPGLAYGFAGDDRLGRELVEIVDARSVDAAGNHLLRTAWEELVDCFWNWYIEILKDRRDRAIECGTKARNEDLINVLIAGYVNGMAGIVEFYSHGGKTLSNREGDAIFMGSGTAHAKVSVDTMAVQTGESRVDEQRFRIAVGIGASSTADCGGGLDGWRITESGMQPIEM